MSTITKEWLRSQISAIKTVSITDSNTLQAFEIALASLEADGTLANEGTITATQLKPVSVPDERYQHLSEIYHAQEKRLFKLAQRIKGESFDKYSHSPSQAIDVLESAIFGESAEEDSRSAMLQGADNELQRKAAIHDALCEKYNVESLADFVEWQRNHIAELEAAPPAPVGEGETAVMPDCPGYVMTQRECFDAGAKRAVPDGWVAVPVEPTMSQEFAGYRTLTDTGKMSRLMKTRLSNIYRAMIAAAPQQEVKP